MLGNFCYSNPTKLYFGKDSLNYLKEELKNYGDNVVLIYGGGSIKKNGIYDQVISILKEAGKNIFEDAGVMPNPTYKKLLEGVEIARSANADLILAVGGGSVIDYAKGVSAGVHCKEDIWDKYYTRFKEPDCDVIPIGSILTMVGTGSEMNGGSVITNEEKKLKIGKVFNERLFPKFSILNPEYTYTVSKYQMVSGIFDIMSHIMEQYFSDEDDNTTDYLAEGLMCSLIKSALDAVKNPLNYEARSNIMWTATWALNTLLDKGKTTDWEVHMMGQAVSAITNAAHGMTLAAVSIPYYKFMYKFGLAKFKRFALNVFKVKDEGSDEEIALAGLDKLSEWMKEIGLVMDLTTLGVNEENIESVVDATLILNGGYKTLTKDEVRAIFKAAL